MLEPGSYVAGYRIERELGSGGMGAVFLARHPELPRSDALKILTSDRAVREQFARRFLREAEVAATLDHPAIVTVYNRGRDRVRIGDDVDDVLWIAMQYVPGTDCARELAEVGDGGGLDPRRVTHIVSEVAKALDHAHRRGLLHRDIKPANILLARDSDDATDVGERVLLTDFGVAKATDEVDPLTRAGTVLATLSYASPEQLQGGPLDGRTDQYSLAATAFHLFTGHVPFDDTVTSDVIRAHLNDPVPRVSIEVATVTQVVDAVIAKAMSKQAPDRFANCREFADALAMAVRGMSGSTAVNPRFVRDRPGSGAEARPQSPRPAAGPSAPSGPIAHSVPPGPFHAPPPRFSGPDRAAAQAPRASGPTGIYGPPPTGPTPVSGSSNAGLIALLVGLVGVAVIIVVLILAAL
ncbi:serine/threonine-protein kinase [Gordonia sp. NPDC003429]